MKDHNDTDSGTRMTRDRYKVRVRVGRGRRDFFAMIPLMLALVAYFVMPAFADTHTYRLAGVDLNTEFVNQPYWMAPGNVGATHYRFQSGLIAFTDGAGVPGQGYCIDLLTHRVHTASYTDGARIDQAGIANAQQVLWLLNNAYPKAPPMLGSDNTGAARSSSVVQAAIWHYSDGFQLDPAGSPYVDAAYRSAYDQLVAAAAPAAALPPASMTLTGPGAVDLNALPGDHGFDVTASIVQDNGRPAPDGTEVNFSSDNGTLGGAAHPSSSPLIARTAGGHAAVHAVPTPAASGSVNLSATASLPVAPGKVLLPNVASQRLVETSWGQESASAQLAVGFSAHSTPTISKEANDETAGHLGKASTQTPAIAAQVGDHLSYETAIGNSGLIPFTGVVHDNLADPKNTLMTKLENVKQYAVDAAGKRQPLPATATQDLQWAVTGLAPGQVVKFGFEADVPKALDLPVNTFFNCAYVTPPTTVSNCVQVVVNTVPNVLAVKLADGQKSGLASPGGTLSYTVAVTNTGTRNLTNVAVTDNLSKGNLALLSKVAVKTGTFDAATRVVAWTIPALAVGATQTVSFTAQVPAADVTLCGTTPTYENVAEASQPGVTGGLQILPSSTTLTGVPQPKCAVVKVIPSASAVVTPSASAVAAEVTPPASGVEAAMTQPASAVEAATTTMPFTGHDIRRELVLGFGLLLTGAGLIMASRKEGERA